MDVVDLEVVVVVLHLDSKLKYLKTEHLITRKIQKKEMIVKHTRKMSILTLNIHIFYT